MSALTDLFTSMANKIRSKTGSSDTYTPTEMVSAVDDVYDAGYKNATTPITPSNSSPASMTSGTGYKPTANGYAISSYREITPSPWQSGTPISSGDIIRFTGDGYAVPEDEEIAPRDVEAPRLDGRTHYFVASRDGGYAVENQPVVIHPSDSHPVVLERGLNYNIMYSDGYAIESQPQSLTPSDNSPASISSGGMYRAGGAGYAIASNPVSLTPSNSSPAAISSGTIYKAGGAGYAVASQPTSKTPSDTSPASVTSGSIVRPSAAGYLYASNTNFKYGTVADKSTASEEFSIDTGLSSISKFILWGRNRNNDRTLVIIYDPNVIGSNKFSSAGIQTGAAAQRPTATIGDNPTAYNGSIKSISDGTVTIKQASSLDNIFASGIQWVAHS